MRKVFLGKPQSPGDFEARHKWLLRSVHEIEHASSERDPEFDAVDKRLAAIEAQLADIVTRLEALEAP